MADSNYDILRKFTGEDKFDNLKGVTGKKLSKNERLLLEWAMSDEKGIEVVERDKPVLKPTLMADLRRMSETAEPRKPKFVPVTTKEKAIAAKLQEVSNRTGMDYEMLSQKYAEEKKRKADSEIKEREAEREYYNIQGEYKNQGILGPTLKMITGNWTAEDQAAERERAARFSEADIKRNPEVTGMFMGLPGMDSAAKMATDRYEEASGIDLTALDEVKEMNGYKAGKVAGSLLSTAIVYGGVGATLNGLKSVGALQNILGKRIGTTVGTFVTKQMVDNTLDVLIQAPIEIIQAIETDESMSEFMKRWSINRLFDVGLNLAIGGLMDAKSLYRSFGVEKSLKNVENAVKSVGGGEAYMKKHFPKSTAFLEGKIVTNKASNELGVGYFGANEKAAVEKELDNFFANMRSAKASIDEGLQNSKRLALPSPKPVVQDSKILSLPAPKEYDNLGINNPDEHRALYEELENLYAARNSAEDEFVESLTKEELEVYVESYTTGRRLSTMMNEISGRKTKANPTGKPSVKNQKRKDAIQSLMDKMETYEEGILLDAPHLRQTGYTESLTKRQKQLIEESRTKGVTPSELLRSLEGKATKKNPHSRPTVRNQKKYEQIQDIIKRQAVDVRGNVSAEMGLRRSELMEQIASVKESGKRMPKVPEGQTTRSVLEGLNPKPVVEPEAPVFKKIFTTPPVEPLTPRKRIFGIPPSEAGATPAKKMDVAERQSVVDTLATEGKPVTPEVADSINQSTLEDIASITQPAPRSEDSFISRIMKRKDEQRRNQDLTHEISQRAIMEDKAYADAAKPKNTTAEEYYKTKLEVKLTSGETVDIDTSQMKDIGTYGMLNKNIFRNIRDVGGKAAESLNMVITNGVSNAREILALSVDESTAQLKSLLDVMNGGARAPRKFWQGQSSLELTKDEAEQMFEFYNYMTGRSSVSRVREFFGENADAVMKKADEFTESFEQMRRLHNESIVAVDPQAAKRYAKFKELDDQRYVLGREASRLNRRLGDMQKGTPEYEAVERQLRSINKKLDESYKDIVEIARIKVDENGAERGIFIPYRQDYVPEYSRSYSSSLMGGIKISGEVGKEVSDDALKRLGEAQARGGMASYNANFAYAYTNYVSHIANTVAYNRVAKDITALADALKANGQLPKFENYLRHYKNNLLNIPGELDRVFKTNVIPTAFMAAADVAKLGIAAGNLSMSVTQFASLANTFGMLGTKNTLRGLYNATLEAMDDIIKNNPEFAKEHQWIAKKLKSLRSARGDVDSQRIRTMLNAESRYNKNKARTMVYRGADNEAAARAIDTAGDALDLWKDAGFRLFGVFDNVTTKITYDAAIAKGLEIAKRNSEGLKDTATQTVKEAQEAYAKQYADMMLENIHGGRTKGMIPLLNTSKAYNTFVPFSLEPANVFQVYEDLIKSKDVAGFARLLAGTYAINKAFEMLRGRDVAFDPVGLIFDIADAFQNEPDMEWYHAVGMATGEFLENYPAGPAIASLTKMINEDIEGAPTLSNSDFFAENDPTVMGTTPLPLSLMQDWRRAIPGYTQFSKTSKAFEILQEEGKYNKDGELMYTADALQNAGPSEMLKALQLYSFGPSAFKETQEYYKDSYKPTLTLRETKAFDRLTKDGDYDRGELYKAVALWKEIKSLESKSSRLLKDIDTALLKEDYKTEAGNTRQISRNDAKVKELEDRLTIQLQSIGIKSKEELGKLLDSTADKIQAEEDRKLEILKGK